MIQYHESKNFLKLIFLNAKDGCQDKFYIYFQQQHGNGGVVRGQANANKCKNGGGGGGLSMWTIPPYNIVNTI